MREVGTRHFLIETTIPRLGVVQKPSDDARKDGGANGNRISQQLLEQMGFKNRTRERIKKALYQIPVIHDGGYRSKTPTERWNEQS
jgi:hypothetical protein